MIKKLRKRGGALFLLLLTACGGSTQSVGAGAGGAQAHAGSSSAPVGGATARVERCRGCAADEDCCLATGHCYSPSRAPEECEPPPPIMSDGGSGGVAGGAGVPLPPQARRCSSNAHCTADEICRPDNDASACVSVGYCVPRSCKLTCLNGADCEKPVCGCDGQTYATEHDACQAGVRTATTAPCGEPVASPGGAPVIGCGTGDDCPDQYRCCEISGRCYPSDCPGCCAPTPPGTNGACERNEHCPAGQYCAGSSCDTAGGCRFPKSAADCGGEVAEVCGCDGKTYTNECWAAAAGSRVASTGRCR